MKSNLFLILFFCSFFIGCSDDNKLNPSEAVLGTYQEILSDLVEGHDVVQTIKLQSGNFFTHESTVRVQGVTEDLGYQFYGEGSFTFWDGVVELNYDKKYALVDPDITFVTKDELDLLETDNAPEFRLGVEEDYNSMTYICPPNANCTEVSVFDRID